MDPKLFSQKFFNEFVGNVNEFIEQFNNEFFIKEFPDEYKYDDLKEIKVDEQCYVKIVNKYPLVVEIYPNKTGIILYKAYSLILLNKDEKIYTIIKFCENNLSTVQTNNELKSQAGIACVTSHGRIIFLTFCKYWYVENQFGKDDTVFVNTEFDNKFNIIITRNLGFEGGNPLSKCHCDFDEVKWSLKKYQIGNNIPYRIGETEIITTKLDYCLPELLLKLLCSSLTKNYDELKKIAYDYYSKLIRVQPYLNSCKKVDIDEMIHRIEKLMLIEENLRDDKKKLMEEIVDLKTICANKNIEIINNNNIIKNQLSILDEKEKILKNNEIEIKDYKIMNELCDSVSGFEKIDMIYQIKGLEKIWYNYYESDDFRQLVILYSDTSKDSKFRLIEINSDEDLPRILRITEINSYEEKKTRKYGASLYLNIIDIKKRMQGIEIYFNGSDSLRLALHEFDEIKYQDQ
jgi:hypothetical protein